MPRQFTRGAVYKSEIILPVRTVPVDGGQRRWKYLVVLQGGPAFAHSGYVAVVIASTLDRNADDVEAYEVVVGTTEGFQHDTVIDCHRVYTFPKHDLPESGRLRTIWGGQMTLPPAVMDEVSAAIVIGLQL